MYKLPNPFPISLAACLLIALATSLMPLQSRALPLKVVTEISPPAQTLVDGQVSGVVTERVRKVLTDANQAAQIRAYPWARAYDLALSTPNTLIYAMARTPQREALFKWIGPVGRYALGFMQLSRNQPVKIQTLQDAKAYMIAVQRQDVALEVLKQHGFEEGKQLLVTADIQQSWTLLLKNKVDLVIDDPDAIDDMLQSMQLKTSDVRFAYMIPELEQLTYLAASLNTNDSLVEALRQSLQKQQFQLSQP
ncbi:substrate-binding periplasmic protein [Bowmanella denitrificans]|uniref:substrate-binding periplasmic protein n=1 Tax=Bowmanella denitrificans TaxID=366582 RepID=UPI0011AF617F|nr:transporter substrate-binding domain-containing protein [Bowmanella denitrificans]